MFPKMLQKCILCSVAKNYAYSPSFIVFCCGYFSNISAHILQDATVPVMQPWRIKRSDES